MKLQPITSLPLQSKTPELSQSVSMMEKHLKLLAQSKTAQLVEQSEPKKVDTPQFGDAQSSPQEERSSDDLDWMKVLSDLGEGDLTQTDSSKIMKDRLDTIQQFTHN